MIALKRKAAMSMGRALIVGLAFAWVLVVGGCTGDGPSISPVTGVVTMDGKPLAGKLVVFGPENGRPSEGVTNAEGRYELRYTSSTNGAIVGHHKVTITTPRFGEYQKGWVETVPVKYHGESTLTAEVKSKRNVIDFALTSDEGNAKK